jgi:hypothetical protein
MSEDLQKMFVEDAPQQVNELNNVESLSSHVLELQRLEDEIKIEEEKLSRKKQQADKLSQQDKKEGAFNWLRNNDLGDLIKNEITVSFGRNEDNKASEYANLAESNGYQPVQKLKVEPMTLKALFRERVEKDLDLPSEHFNLFKGNKTKITRNK